MEKSHREKIISELKKQVVEMLEENTEQIIAAYEAVQKATGNNDVKYTVPIKATIKRESSNTYNVSSSLGYSVKRTDERTNLIRTDKDMVDAMGGTDPDNMTPPAKRGRKPRHVA